MFILVSAKYVQNTREFIVFCENENIDTIHRAVNRGFQLLSNRNTPHQDSERFYEVLIRQDALGFL